MHIAITGASGLIGRALVPALEAEGHEVVRLVRRPAEGPSEATWDPSAGVVDVAALGGVDAIVHLAGASLDARWTAKQKEAILRSRVDGTAAIARAVAALEGPPALISASGAGYYGDRGDEVLTEESQAGVGFLAEVAAAWESAAQPARDAGARVVTLRSGIVLSRQGGALARMLTPFRLGLGGRVGSGRQWWSWIGLNDAVAAYRHVLASTIDGPVNLTAPEPVTSAEFVKALGSALHRPTVFPLPAFAVRAAFGEMGQSLLLEGQRVLPARLLDDGFTFTTPTIGEALATALAR